MKKPAPGDEKTWLLATLAAVIAALTAIVIWRTHHLLVPWWGIGLVGLPWAGSTVLLRAKQDTLGFEGKYVDWWSIPHFLTGVLFGLFGVPALYVAGIAAAWEYVEYTSETPEYATNRATDIVLAAAGWATANVLAGGAFRVL